MAAAEEKTAPKLEEGYIGLYLGQQLIVHVYRVLLDDDEQPYLPVRDLLTAWLELTEETSIVSASKPVYLLNPGRQVYSLDFDLKTASCNGVAFALPPDTLIMNGNELWLRFDQLDKWLPLKSRWDLNQYSLFLYPQYKTRGQVQAERRSMLSDEATRQAEAELLGSAEVRLPEYGALSVKSILKLNYPLKVDPKPAGFESATELNWDLPQGNLYLNCNNLDLEFASLTHGTENDPKKWTLGDTLGDSTRLFSA
ncbi:MAG: hypothetical protein PHW04_15980, partial [Candidatus Wallbacteria bacterium]|nr:hypothetical protein [Candidatus Wallbacteria bacterium]